MLTFQIKSKCQTTFIFPFLNFQTWEPFIREETILPPLDPCPYGKIKYNIDLKKKEIMIPGVTCETQHFDCSTLPMKFYSFSGKPATTPSEY